MNQLFAVIGDPILHSMSPIMHNDAFAALHMPHHYHAFQVKSKHLEEAVKGLKALGVSGFNVTIPHKVEIMDYLDEIDEEARLIGAVNTVVLKNERFIGYNTDGQGFYESLLEFAPHGLKNKHVLIIGAGGAARAIYTTLLRRGVERVDLANRTKDRAQTLVSLNHAKEQTTCFSIQEAEDQLGYYDILINTTSVGMHPHTDQMPIKLTQMKKGTILADIIYNPLQTKWLAEGQKKGGIPLNGVPMFVNQGALAFEKWLGVKPDRKRMTNIVLKQLGG